MNKIEHACRHIYSDDDFFSPLLHFYLFQKISRRNYGDGTGCFKSVVVCLSIAHTLRTITVKMCMHLLRARAYLLSLRLWVNLLCCVPLLSVKPPERFYILLLFNFYLFRLSCFFCCCLLTYCVTLSPDGFNQAVSQEWEATCIWVEGRQVETWTEVELADTEINHSELPDPGACTFSRPHSRLQLFWCGFVGMFILLLAWL